MEELFATCAKPGKFRWEKGARNEAIAELVGQPADRGQAQLQNMQDDPFLVNDKTNPDQVSCFV